MMAKMFYTLDETKAALSKNEEEVKQLAREGRLREFRDGPRLMFKADQVEQLKGELGGSGAGMAHVDLGPSETGAPIGLVDSRGASGTSITLTDTDAGAPLKDDTATGADLGLSGSLGGIPSPGKTGAVGSGLSGSVAAGSGVTVFRPDEVERVDPMAQTAMSGSLQDQVNLEGVGSGSGLLDLTRESDDTSLGAELLDEITPGGAAGRRTAPPAAGDSAGRSGVDMGALGAAGGRVISAPTYVEAADPMAPALGAAALAAAAMVIFGGFVVTSAVLGYFPTMVDSAAGNGVWALFGIGLVAAIVLFVIGLFIGKAKH